MQFGPTSARPCSRAIRATSACIAAAASPPSTTPPPGMMTAGTPAAAAASVTDAARNGLSATTAMSGPLRERVERRVARLAVELVVLRVDEVAARLAAHDPQVVADRLGDPRPRRGADDGDAARREQRPQVDDAAGCAVGRGYRAHPDDPADAPLLERPGDDQPLDLRGPLPDPVDAQLAQEPLGGELAHVAAAAEDLDHAVGAAEGRLRREQLGQRRLGVDDLGIGAGVGEPGALAGQQPRRGRVGGRIGQREADALEVVDPLAELDALGGPLERQRQQPLHRAGAARADVDALLDEPLVGQVVRPPDAAEDRRRRDAHVGQHELRVAVGERVRVVGVVLDDDAGRVVVDQEQRRPALARRRRRGSGRS